MLLDPFLQHGSPQGSLHRDISIRFITEAPFAFASLPALYFGTAFKIQTTVWIFKDYDSIIPGLHGKLCRRNYWELVCSCKHEDLKFTSFVGWFTNPHAFVSSTLHNNRPTQATGLCLRIKSFLIWCWTCSLFFWESQPSRISTLAELVQPCCCVIREKLTRLMKCNLTGEGWGGVLPTAGGVSIRYAAVFCMPGLPHYITPITYRELWRLEAAALVSGWAYGVGAPGMLHFQVRVSPRHGSYPSEAFGGLC